MDWDLDSPARRLLAGPGPTLDLARSPVRPWATRSCTAARKGATPVPGPTIITGVSGVCGKVRPPDRAHKGTCTGPVAGWKWHEESWRTRVLAQDWREHTWKMEGPRPNSCPPPESRSPCSGSRDASQEEQRPRRGSLRRVWYCTTATRICSLEG